MKADEVIEVEVTGWTNPPIDGEAPVVRADVRLGPAPPGKVGSLLSVVVGGVETHALLHPFSQVTRKLRRLATFHRGQQRFGSEMDVQDELRAMEVLAKTLDSLSEDASDRVLEWLMARTKAMVLRRLTERGGGYPSVHQSPSVEESIRMVKEHVNGGRA